MGAPPPTPALSLHSTALFDIHLEAAQDDTPFKSMANVSQRTIRVLPLLPQLPKLKPATVADVLPDDGPFVKPPTELTTAAS